MDSLTAIAQNDANFIYPAVTDAELADQRQLVVGYRRSMGKVRILGGLLVLGALAWTIDYVQHPRKRGP